MIVAEGDSHYYNFDMGTWNSCAECRLNLHAVLFCLYSIAVFENSRTSSSQGGRGEFETEKKQWLCCRGCLDTILQGVGGIYVDAVAGISFDCRPLRSLNKFGNIYFGCMLAHGKNEQSLYQTSRIKNDTSSRGEAIVGKNRWIGWCRKCGPFNL